MEAGANFVNLVAMRGNMVAKAGAQPVMAAA
jgi:hypothetical protein